MKVVLPLVIVDRDDLLELQKITGPSRLVVCELSAPREVLERRVVEREPNDLWRSIVRNFVALYQDPDDHAALCDFQLSTDSRTVEDTANEVIHLCGWRLA